MFFARSIPSLAAAGLLGLVVALSSPVASAKARRDESSHPKLTTLDKREESVLHARAQVLALLHENNACSAWFQESVDDPAGVFESLQFKFETKQTAYIVRAQSYKDRGLDLFKHPWAARSRQFAGPNSTVHINLDGPFFTPSSQLVELSPAGGISRQLGPRMLTVGPFKGDSPEARITILLHELGHIVDRIPADEDSWDGNSSRNTAEVLRHCKSEIREFAKRPAGELE